MEGNFKIYFVLILETLTSYNSTAEMHLLEEAMDKTLLKNGDGKMQ